MILWSIIGVGLLTLFGFEIDFIVWLVAMAIIQTITAYTLTKNASVFFLLAPAVVTGIMSLMFVPFLLSNAELDVETVSLLSRFFNAGPIFMFGIALGYSTVVGVFNPRPVKVSSD